MSTTGGDDPVRRPDSAEAPARAGAGVGFWRSVPIFRDLSEPVCAELSTVSRRQRWPAGSMLFHRNDESTHMVAVEEGRIRLSLQTAGGREFALRHAGAGP